MENDFGKDELIKLLLILTRHHFLFTRNLFSGNKKNKKFNKNERLFLFHLFDSFHNVYEWILQLQNKIGNEDSFVNNEFLRKLVFNNLIFAKDLITNKEIRKCFGIKDTKEIVYLINIQYYPLIVDIENILNLMSKMYYDLK